ncbi:MAG TPA: GntR family transcriptional regulator [Solirubrobacterales bacterium]|nr:GntR family transcriptional regulator [Solirubrobacterales bacterium]
MASNDAIATVEAGDGYEPRAERVARWLREEIYARRLRPGQPIRQEAVAEELGLSRIPVREALKQLETEGLVVLRPHSGARVASLDLAECEDIYKMRERLEPLAIAESVPNISDEQIDEARRLAEGLRELDADPSAWIEGDRRFHLACYAGIEGPRLLQTITGFWNTTQHYRRAQLEMFDAHDFEVSHAEHMLIVDALATRRPRLGEEVMRAHIEASRLRLAAHPELFDS